MAFYSFWMLIWNMRSITGLSFSFLLFTYSTTVPIVMLVTLFLQNDFNGLKSVSTLYSYSLTTNGVIQSVVKPSHPLILPMEKWFVKFQKLIKYVLYHNIGNIRIWLVLKEFSAFFNTVIFKSEHHFCPSFSKCPLYRNNKFS